MQRRRPPPFPFPAPAQIFSAFALSVASLSWPETVRANDCSVSLDGISSATAADYGMRRTPGGYTLNIDALESGNGGAGRLLAQVDEQLSANMKWFHAMETIVADPATPMLADVQLLYEQGRETHEVLLAIARSLRCQLGVADTPQQRPQTVASLQASREARIAQANAEQAAQARSEASKQSFWNTVGTLGNVLGAVGSALSGSRPQAPVDNCGRDSHGRCEVVDPGR